MSGIDRGKIYAILGDSCQTSSAVLISNTKFIPMDDPVYEQFYTHTHLYPAWNETMRDEEVQEPRQRVVKSSCCGK